MLIYTEKTYKNLLICGDVHGDENVIPNFIRDRNLDTCAVFQAGDYGIGFETEHREERWLKYQNERMKNSDSDLFVIRGNHDDPKYFDGNTKMSNITLLKDYTVVNINGWNVLGVGGAVSVDRTDRTSWWWHQAKKTKSMNDWWVGEVVDFQEEILNELRDIDIIVTHSAPTFCPPLTKGNIKHWLAKDEELDTDISVERYLLTRMYGILKQNNDISEWYYGHFHIGSKSYDEKTTFTALNINEIVASPKIYNNDKEND